MANPPCMSEDGNQAVFLGTFLAEGQTVALCDECLVPWSAALLQAMTGVDPKPFLEAISEGAPEAPAESDNEAPAETLGAAGASDPPHRNGGPKPAAGTPADAATEGEPPGEEPPGETEQATPAA